MPGTASDNRCPFPSWSPSSTVDITRSTGKSQPGLFPALYILTGPLCPSLFLSREFLIYSPHPPKPKLEEARWPISCLCRSGSESEGQCLEPGSELLPSSVNPAIVSFAAKPWLHLLNEVVLLLLLVCFVKTKSIPSNQSPTPEESLLGLSSGPGVGRVVSV